MIHDFYLRAKTSAGTLHLPLVNQEVKEDGLELIFNWVVFEKDVTLYSYQPFAEVGRPDDDPETCSLFPDSQVIENYEVAKKVQLTSHDEMHRMPAGEVGCFTFTIPFAFLRDLDPSYVTEA